MIGAGENVFFINADYTIQKASRKLLQNLGEKDDGVVGKTCYKHFFRLEQPCENCPVARSVTYQTVVEHDIPIEENNDRVRHAIATPVMDENNHVRQIIIDCLGDTIEQQHFGRGSSARKGQPGAAPQLPIEEHPEATQTFRFMAMFDADFTIFECRAAGDEPAFGGGQTLIGRNLFVAAPFYNQQPIREKISAFVSDRSLPHLVFSSKSTVYADEWLEHRLYALSGQSGAEAYLLISSSQGQGGIVNSRALLADKVAMLSKFASRVSHDVKNPLSLISTSVEFLRTDLSTVNTLDGVHKLFDYIDQIQNQVDRVIDILDTVNALKVHSMDSITETDAADLLERAVTITLLSRPFPDNDINIKIPGKLPPLPVAEMNMERALSELFKSLLKKAGEGGQLDITLTYVDQPKEQFVFKIQSNLHQNGLLDLDELLMEFFANGKRFNVTNLGLIIAYATIINHAGEMDVLTTDTGEMQIIVKLPRFHGVD